MLFLASGFEGWNSLMKGLHTEDFLHLGLIGCWMNVIFLCELSCVAVYKLPNKQWMQIINSLIRSVSPLGIDFKISNPLSWPEYKLMHYNASFCIEGFIWIAFLSVLRLLFRILCKWHCFQWIQLIFLLVSAP